MSTTTSSTNEGKSASRPRSISASKQSKSGPHENEQVAAKGQAPTSVQPIEPEDAYLTGVSRSLQRRLLGLNVEGSQGQSKPNPEATTAGIHSTGSYTKGEGEKPASTKGKKK